MEIGITSFTTDLAISPVQLAHEAEQRGFYSLYLPEHTHIPISRRTPPPTGEAELPEEYKRTLDPYIALAAAASVTERIRLGTGIALVAQHDPITLAKQLATLDRLSRGRLVLGIGYGWNEDEMANHGVAMKTRRDRVRETLLSMQQLWANDVASYAGEHVRFEPSWQWPKPVQQPRPRVLLGGGAGPTLFRHIAEYADGWLPIGGAGLAASLGELRRVVEEAGRDFAALHIVPMGVEPTREKLDHYRQAGVTEAVLRVPSAPRDEVLPVLDAFARDYLGA